VVTPVTAFIVSPNPVMSAVPGIIPLIMLGNAVLVVLTYFLVRPAVTGEKFYINPRSVIMAVLSCLAKGCIMGLTISLWLLPTFIPAEAPIRAKLPVLQTTFSVTQFVTALIGFVYFFILWKPVSKIAAKY
jgi:hypothetical protein